MQLLLLNGAALTIALLYVFWRIRYLSRRRQGVIRERIALLLWTVAQEGAPAA